jgi:hypothetical protein
MGDAFFIEDPFYLSPKIAKQLRSRRKSVWSAFVLSGSMPMIIGCFLRPIASASPCHSVSIIKAQPWRASSLGTWDKGVAYAMGPLGSRVDSPGGKLHDNPRSHLESRAVERKQGLKLAFVHSAFCLAAPATAAAQSRDTTLSGRERFASSSSDHDVRR